MLNSTLHELLIGAILGDATMERNGRHVRIRFDHGIAQEEYVWWKYRMLERWATSPPRRVSRYDKRTNRVYVSVRFSTISDPVFDWYLEQFLIETRKGIPAHIGALLQRPMALAVWYMDDGYHRNDCRAFRLNTQAYTEEEQARLRIALQNNFQIVTHVHRQRAQRMLYVPSASYEHFRGMLRPYIIPSMMYKLGDPVTTDSQSPLG